MNFLACDLGGTKVLLGIFKKNLNDDTPNLLLKKKYISSEWSSFELILEGYYSCFPDFYTKMHPCRCIFFCYETLIFSLQKRAIFLKLYLLILIFKIYLNLRNKLYPIQG